jgi:hypothetical protein
MTTIYNFDGNRIYTGITREIDPYDGITEWWTDVPPPPLQDGQYASFLTPGWVVLDGYPYPTPFSPPASTPTDLTTNSSTDAPMVL